jgi:hypothetical protein
LNFALRLVVSPRTVNAHLNSIYRKIDVSSRNAAAHCSGCRRMPAMPHPFSDMQRDPNSHGLRTLSQLGGIVTQQLVAAYVDE